jgi:hypothetical protein
MPANRAVVKSQGARSAQALSSRSNFFALPQVGAPRTLIRPSTIGQPGDPGSGIPVRRAAGVSEDWSLAARLQNHRGFCKGRLQCPVQSAKTFWHLGPRDDPTAFKTKGGNELPLWRALY